MLSFLQYMLALVISAHESTPQAHPAFAPDWIGILLSASAFGLVWTTWGIVRARRLPDELERAVPGFLRTVAVGRVTALCLFWFMSQMLMAREIPHALGIADWVLVPHLIRLVPFALLLILLRAGLHPVGVRLQLEPPGLLETLRWELGEAVLPLGPLLLLLSVWDPLTLATPASALGAVQLVFANSPLVQSALALGMLFLALVITPFVVRLTWRARPLAPGPLRTRLDGYSERVGLRARDILVLPTGGAQMNAFVVGPLPWARYVFLSDALVDTLGHDEIEAVFAHEAGHARRGHILLFFGFTAVLVLASVLPQALGAAAGGPLDSVNPLVRSIAMCLVWIGVIFGWVSRRFEQEADVFGIDTATYAAGEAEGSGVAAEHPFARALERIAEETGGIREITGWRHFSIADRVDFVRDYLSDERVRARYRRSIGWLRGTLLLLIGGFTVAALTQVPREVEQAERLWEVASAVRAEEREPQDHVLARLRDATSPGMPAGRAQSFLRAARLSELAGDHVTALRWLRSAASLAPSDPSVLEAYATALSEAQRPRGAARVWRDLLRLEHASDMQRRYAAAALSRLPTPGD